MKPATVEVWIWVLVYGGLLALALGLYTRAAEPRLGWPLVVGGALAATIGAALVFVRARMKP